MQEDIDDIDLSLFLETNDIRLYTEILDIAMHANDRNLRELTILSLPSTTGLLQIGVEMLNTMQKGKDLDKYSDYELAYIERLKELRDSRNDSLRSEIKTENKRKLYTAVNFESKTKLDETQEQIKQILNVEDISKVGVISWNRSLRIYKESEPIYVEGPDGKIYTLDKHPNLGIDLSNENIIGIAIVPSILRLSGYDDELIEKIQKIMTENGLKDDKPKVERIESRMSKYQVGKTPYLIGFEEK